MSDMTDPFSRPVVLQLPATDVVAVRSNLRWGVEDDQLFDVYRPPQFEGLRLPLVILVTGYADPGFKAMTGRRMKDTAPYESWARLIASSGLVAVTYANHDPVPDATGVLRYLADHANELGIDTDRCGIWACSGNVPNALAVLAGNSPARVRCAALCYGYMLDLEGSTAVADASRQFKFAAPPTPFDRIPADVPLLIVRAGRDEMPGLNDSIDHFRSHAASAGFAVQFLEHPSGPHAFDIMDDSAASRDVVSGIVDFLSRNLPHM